MLDFITSLIHIIFFVNDLIIELFMLESNFPMNC